jgi:hypothetical protein
MKCKTPNIHLFAHWIYFYYIDFLAKCNRFEGGKYVWKEASLFDHRCDISCKVIVGREHVAFLP